MNKVEAIKATRNGAIAACISAVSTVVIVLLAMRADPTGKFAYWNDPSTLWDVALILACAFGIYKKSRFASVVMFVYFFIAKIIIAMNTNPISGVTGIALGLIFLYFFGRAIQGAFVFHKLEREENPDHKPPKKWLMVTGAIAGIVIVGVIGFGMMIEIGVFPPAKVQSAKEIRTEDIRSLRNAGIISTEDEIEFLYVDGLFSVLDGGAILTNDRVMVYFPDDKGGPVVYEISLDEITEVILDPQQSNFGVNVYRVNTGDPEKWFSFPLAIEGKGDEAFINRIRAQISK